MPDRLPRVLGCALLVFAAGCATVSPSADRAGPAAAASGELDAARLRAAALAEADLGQGWTVTVMTPGHGGTAPDSERQIADVPACQPVLDAVAPAQSASGPLAETDLSVARAADSRATVYAGLLAFSSGRATRLQTELDQVLAHCVSFTSAAASGATPRKDARTRHRLTRTDTPTPEGADAVTAFTLTNESGSVELDQHALVARTGTVLAVLSTVGSGKEPAPEPDPQVVRAQLTKLRAAQRGR